MSDITYLPVGNGQFFYLATVLHLCSKQLAGGPISHHMRTSLVTDALMAATADRGTGDLRGAIFHSDNGAQYASKGLTQVCGDLGVIRSRGAVGTGADNADYAAAESLTVTMNARRSRAGNGGTGPVRPGSQSSDGRPATTPDEGTPASARSARSLRGCLTW